MSQAFRSLAEILRCSPASREAALPQPSTEPAHVDAVHEVEDRAVGHPFPNHELSERCASLALVRLAAIEAYERAARRLLEAFARDVLARELALEGADIEALLRRSLDAFAAEEPVAVVLSPADAERASCDLPIRADATLASGDLVLVVRDGAIHSRLALRLESALDEVLA